LAEGVERFPAARYVGGDADAQAVARARERLNSRGVSAETWRAEQLPPDVEAPDCIVCNLPFGRQYSSPSANRQLYPCLLREWLRRLKPGGRMVLLTADDQSLKQSASSLGLVRREVCRVKVLGLWAGIHVLRRP
jgi:23S rRNA G2445 N2-methylase RlmL